MLTSASSQGLTRSGSAMILARAACTPSEMLTACTCTKHQSILRHLPLPAASWLVDMQLDAIGPVCNHLVMHSHCSGALQGLPLPCQ